MMIVYLDTYILGVYLHYVGNKIADEGFLMSTLPIELNENIKNVLSHIL